MNYFKINGVQYLAEIRRNKNAPPGQEFYAILASPSLFNIGWEADFRALRGSRPAARRALKRELERLAIGPDGKRQNFDVVYPWRDFEAKLRRVTLAAEVAAAGMGDVRDATERMGESSARRFIAHAAAKLEIPAAEFARRVRREVV